MTIPCALKRSNISSVKFHVYNLANTIMVRPIWTEFRHNLPYCLCSNTKVRKSGPRSPRSNVRTSCGRVQESKLAFGEVTSRGMDGSKGKCQTSHRRLNVLIIHEAWLPRLVRRCSLRHNYNATLNLDLCLVHGPLKCCVFASILQQ